MRNYILAVLIVVSFIGINSLNAQLIKTTVGVTGSVLDQVSKEPTSVNLDVYDISGKKINSTRSNGKDNGYYYIAGLKPGQTYFVTIKEDGYFKERYKIDVPNTDRYLELSRDFLVKPLEKMTMIKIPVPPFELNKSKLRYGAGFLLNDLTSTLINNPDVNFKIVSFPDNKENPAMNEALTTERAESLMDYFVIQGVDPSRITVEGNKDVDTKNPPPTEKAAKGKRYVGPTYIVVTKY